MISAEAEYKLGRFTSKPCILIVDDEEDILRPILTRVILHYRGDYEPIICIDGNEALASVSRHQIALIVLDIQMPNLDGVGVCRFLREHPQYRRIPILISSGYIDEELKKELEPLGIRHYLSKPYTMDALTEYMDRILDWRHYH